MKGNSRGVGVTSVPSILLFAVILVHPSVSFAQTWQSFAPGATTEDDVIRIYGKPPNVVLRFIGFDAFDMWRRNGMVARYDFEYFLGGLIQNGPLGEAHKTVVAFGADKKLWEVQWSYLTGLRLHRGSGEPATRITLSQIEGVLGGNPIIRKLGQGGQGLSIYRFKRDGAIIEVEYYGEGGDIDVHLSAGGIYPLQ